MRTIRTVFRLIRWFAMVYTGYRAVRTSSWLFVVMALWRILRRRPAQPLVRDIALVDGSDPTIYRRAGWRYIVPVKGERV